MGNGPGGMEILSHRARRCAALAYCFQTRKPVPGAVLPAPPVLRGKTEIDRQSDLPSSAKVHVSGSRASAYYPFAKGSLMSLAAEYDKWHEKVFESDPEHADESSPWYNIVMDY